MLPFHTHFAPLLYPLGKKSVPLHFKRRFLEEKKIKEKLLLLKLFTQAKLHNAEHYSTNVYYFTFVSYNSLLCKISQDILYIPFIAIAGVIYV